MASAPPAPRPTVSESALDFLLLETVRGYRDKGEAGRRAVEAMGYRVGTQLAERYTKDRARFTEPTEAILFVCKEFWPEVFKKRVDNLKTNNRGTFVLTDAHFRWTRHLKPAAAAHHPGGAAAAAHARFPAGLLRGALTAVGCPCAVAADASNLPACVFTVKLDRHG